jgi:hypothetical protein
MEATRRGTVVHDKRERKNTTRAQDCGKGSWAAEPSPPNQVQLSTVISPEPPVWGTVTSQHPAAREYCNPSHDACKRPCPMSASVLLLQEAATAHLFIAVLCSRQLARSEDTRTN